MSSPDQLDDLLALGSERPPKVEACVDESAIDDGDLLAYRRGTLTDEQRELVETHLIACPYCRDFTAHIEAPHPRFRWAALAGGVVAAIAAGVLFVATPPPREPIGRYSIAEVRGQVAKHRDRPDLDGRMFRPDSQVAIKVEPSAGRGASLVRVYRIDQGLLVEVAATIERGTAGVFWIKGSGRTLFGEVSGAKRIVIAAADQDADLSRIAGRTLMAAQSLTTQTSWLPLLDIDYRAD